MPYSRRTYSRRPNYRNYRKRYNYRQQKLSTKTVQKIARTEARKIAKKDNPIQYTDIIFTGGNVNTTPTMHSFGDVIRRFINDNSAYNEWPIHDRDGSTVTRQATIYLTGIRYQLRFQQDVENIESSNTFRTMMYSFIDTYDENNVPLLQGADIDLPANTEKVKSMYFDRMRNLRAGTYDPGSTDEADPTPGTAIIKGTKRLYHKFVYEHNSSFTSWNSGDVRWEAQSDSIGSGLQLYGYIRLYFRIVE